VPFQWAIDGAPYLKQVLQRLTVGSETVIPACEIIPSKSVASEAFAAAADVLDRAAERAIPRKRWYPRLWKTWSHRDDGIDVPDVTVTRRSEKITISSDRRIELESLGPDFVRLAGIFDVPIGPRWATVEKIQAFGAVDVATAVPFDIENMPMLYKALVPAMWMGHEGAVLPTDRVGERQLRTLPSGADLFTHWVRQRGWTYRPSTSGRVANRIIQTLGGLGRVGLIRFIVLLETLNRLAKRDEFADELPGESTVSGASRPRVGWIRAAELRSRLTKQYLRPRIPGEPSEQYDRERERADARAEEHLGLLLEHDVLRLGLQLVCAECERRSWYGYKALTESVECDWCLKPIPFPLVSPERDAPWHYRPAGSFAIDRYADGAYGVALSLRFLCALDHQRECSWSTGFDLIGKGLGDGCEVDFAVMLKEPMGLSPLGPEILFGESKSGDAKFLAKDFARAEALMQQMPGVGIVFSTTRDALDSYEVEAIRTLVRQQNALAAAGHAETPIVVLTARELSSEVGAPDCWRGVLEVGQIQPYNPALFASSLASVTQHLYLGNPNTHG
jgi:hypothetical protein